MDSRYTIIPFKQRDRIVRDLKNFTEGLNDIQQIRMETIIYSLELWTQWDDDVRKIVGEAEEEQRQASTLEVSEISAASF